MRQTMQANSDLDDAIKNDPNIGLEVLLADASVEHLNVLLSGLRSNVEVHLLTSLDNPIDYVASVFTRSNLDTLHVLGHGAPGEIILGSQKLDIAALQLLKNKLTLQTTQSLRDSMTTNNSNNQNSNSVNYANTETQICLWSCQTGAGQVGQDFMNTLANITNSTVFATEHLVGNQSKGGTWNLEKTASPRRGAPFNATALEEFDGVLAITGDTWYYNASATDSAELGTIDDPFTFNDTWINDIDWTTDALNIANGSLLTVSALIASGANFIGAGKVKISVTGNTSSFSTTGFNFDATGGYSFSISAGKKLSLSKSQVQLAEAQTSISTVFTTTAINPGTLIITGVSSAGDMFGSLHKSAALIVDYAPVITSAEVRAGDVIYRDTSANDVFVALSGSVVAVDVNAGDSKTYSINGATTDSSLAGLRIL